MKNRKTKTNVHVIEMVADPSLARQNAKASKVLKRFFPDARGLQLYRTAEGEIGIQIDLDFKPGDRELLDTAYDAIIKVSSEKHGRPRDV